MTSLDVLMNNDDDDDEINGKIMIYQLLSFQCRKFLKPRPPPTPVEDHNY